MKTIEPLTPLAEALRLASLGYYVVPLHESTNGVCTCLEGADCRTPAKHPRTTHAQNDGTRDEDQLRRWWKRWPNAGVGICLDLSGLVLVSPDSEQWQKTFRSWFLPNTTQYRSREDEPWHEGFLYRRPDDCPLTKINETEKYDIIANGIAVAPPSIHPKTGDVRSWVREPIAVDELPECPRQAVELLIARVNKRAATASFCANGDDPPVRLKGDALAHWTGERHAAPDRSGSLFVLAKDLYRANATLPTIIDALADRDVALGFNKYANRPDAEARYLETAQRAAADVDAEQNDPKLNLHQEDGPCNQRVAELEAENEQLRAEVVRLKGRISQFFQVIRNPNVKAEKLTALAVVNEAASAESRSADRDGWVAVSRAAIADKCGNSEATVSNHIGRLDDWGVIERRVVRKRVVPESASRTIDYETGEILNGPSPNPGPPVFLSELQIRLRGTPEAALDTLAAIDPFTPKKWGGKRIFCPDHPNATIVNKHTRECGDCGRILTQSETYETPEGLPAEQPERLKSKLAISGDPPGTVDVVKGAKDVISGEGAPLFAAPESRNHILLLQTGEHDVCQMPDCESRLYDRESRKLGYCLTHRQRAWGSSYAAAGGVA